MRKHKEYRYVIIILIAFFLLSACFLNQTSIKASEHDVVFVLEGEGGSSWRHDVAQIKERLALFMRKRAYNVEDSDSTLTLTVSAQAIDDLPAFQSALYYYVFARKSPALIAAEQNTSLIIPRHEISNEDIVLLRYLGKGQYELKIKPEVIAAAQKELHTTALALMWDGTLEGMTLSHTGSLKTAGDAFLMSDAQDPQGTYHELTVYDATHPPLGAPYLVRMISPINWEVPGFSLAQKMQKKETDITNGLYLRYTAALGEKATDADWRQAIKTLKKRLNARAIPYALGYDSFDEHTVIIKTEKMCLNGNILTLLALDDATPVIYDEQSNRYIDLTNITYQTQDGSLSCDVSAEDLERIKRYGSKAYFVVHDIRWGVCDVKDETRLRFTPLPDDAYAKVMVDFLRVFAATTYSLEIVWTLTSIEEDAGVASLSRETQDSTLAQYPEVKAHVVKQAKALSPDNVVIESLMKEKTLIIQVPITIDEHLVETIRNTFQTIISQGAASYFYHYDITFTSGDNIYRLTYYNHTWHVYLYGDDIQAYKTQLQEMWKTELLKGEDDETQTLDTDIDLP